MICGTPSGSCATKFKRSLSTSVRPNGSGDLSPGLRPKADALGSKGPHRCGLKGRENPTRQEGSRGPSGRNGLSSLPPRASAFGLSPGLRSPGPLGRTEPDVLGLPCSGELVQLFCDESLVLLCQIGRPRPGINARATLEPKSRVNPAPGEVALTSEPASAGFSFPT